MKCTLQHAASAPFRMSMLLFSLHLALTDEPVSPQYKHDDLKSKLSPQL